MSKNQKDEIELIKKIKSGDQQALEKFFELKLDYIKYKASIYMKKFSDISDDFEEYYSIIYESCLKAIEIFDESKGDFYHLWMRIAKREVIRFVKKTTAIKENMKIINYDTTSELSNAVTELELSDYYDRCHEFADFINKHDFYDKTISFIDKNFSERDKDMFLMWLNGYSYGEISKKYNISYSCAASRIYNIIDILKYKFC